MGERIQLCAFNEVNRERFSLALENALKGEGWRIAWDEIPQPPARDCRTAHTTRVQSMYVPYLGGLEERLICSIGRVLGNAWITLLIQEGTLWEYTLYYGAQLLDRFSVAPEYWHHSKGFAAQRRGKPQVLAEKWGVAIEEIERYLVNWQVRELDEHIIEFARTGKAYPADRFNYGSFNQVFDFLRALGGADPTNLSEGARQHALIAPIVEF